MLLINASYFFALSKNQNTKTIDDINKIYNKDSSSSRKSKSAIIIMTEVNFLSVMLKLNQKKKNFYAF